MMNIHEALSWGAKELKSTNTTEPEASVAVLLGDVMDLSRTALQANREQELTTQQQTKFSRYVERRKEHESVWHILGYVIFWGLDFEVNQDVLVPRPETEILVEMVVNKILARNYDVKRVLDVGTGSGTIAISLGSEFPEINITATDVSEDVLKIARKNARNNGIRNVSFRVSNLFKNVEGTFEIITANLPYISTEDMDKLMPEVKAEPRLALDGGKDGLRIYEQFLRELPRHLSPTGSCYCEIGVNQGKEFKNLVRKYLPQAKVDIVRDFAGIDRIAIITLEKKEVTIGKR